MTDPLVRWDRVIPGMGGALITVGVHAESFDRVLDHMGLEWDEDLDTAVKLFVPEMLKAFAGRAKRAAAAARPPDEPPVAEA